MNHYIVEITDTFGGEFNYSWIRRYIVKAKSMRGAIVKIAHDYGNGWRKEHEDCDGAVYKMRGDCIGAAVIFADGAFLDEYSKNFDHKLI